MGPSAPVPTVPMIPTNPQVPTMSPGGQNPPYALSNCPPILPPNPMQNPGPQIPSFPTPGQFNTNPILSQPTGGTMPMPSGPMFNQGNVEVAQPAVNAFALPPMALPGWNDPPMVSRGTRLSQVSY